MLYLDYSIIFLISINIMQMVSILLLVLPIVDIVTLSKYIKQYKEILQHRPLFRTLATIYALIIIGYGILGPTRTLNKLKLPKYVREGETAQEKLLRVIDSTNAIRNYLLAGFSLFYLLVIWRLFDFIIFSAKLHEFSDLMGNYDMIDITFITEADDEEPESPFLIDDTLDEDVNSVHWPSVAELSKTEQIRIQTFFKDTPKKNDAPNYHDKINNTSKVINASCSKPALSETGQEQANSEQSTSNKEQGKQTSDHSTAENKEGKTHEPPATKEDKSSK